MSRYTYEVDEDNCVKGFDTENPNEGNAPWLLQPDWPNGAPWASREEAELWAQRWVSFMDNSANGRPGASPDKPFVSWEEDETARLAIEQARTETTP